ncbi:sugar phosphate isomerase/epimerase family protein [Leadbettera azotonutricia]|uniref:AP endonuclease, family 2 n=1 Tax=Leadbettera azotonutricia (strain ATCC BAA-888 / DSM 13862 / ZAS-9) TaxID=545695 RepID=F5YDA3_LEAAZ|nr:sugar phosphate isomerase/epimerase family protein [Leadbettera azotonutricia]AEF81327.1 AP endonuclease, family 2 [Leadbettera azotonutricia ZAS-9]
MKIIPSVLNWSYHHIFKNHWASDLDLYLNKAIAIKEKYQIDTLGIDLGLCGDQDVLTHHDKKNILELKAKLDNAGLISIPNVGTLEIHPEPEVTEESLNGIARTMEDAVVLGADHVVFHHNLHGRMTHEKGVRVFYEAARKLNKIAQDRGLICATEEYCSFSGDELYLALRDTPAVGLLNDTGNWLIMGEDPIAAIKKLMGITRHVHLKDYIFEDGIWQSVPLGRGIVDVKRALDIFSDAPVDKILFASIETDLDFNGEDEAMDKSFAYFADWQRNHR